METDIVKGIVQRNLKRDLKRLFKLMRDYELGWGEKPDGPFGPPLEIKMIFTLSQSDSNSQAEPIERCEDGDRG